jgi:hypothetical protein
MMHLLYIIILSLIAAIGSDAQSCSAEKPCSYGCCNKFGYCGFSDEFCDPDVCVHGCHRIAECGSENRCPLSLHVLLEMDH